MTDPQGRTASHPRPSVSELMRRLRRRLGRSRVGRALRRKLVALAQSKYSSEHSAARMKSVALWKQDRRSESIEVLRGAIVAFGNDDRTWYLYGSRLRSAGRTDAAIEAVKMALDLQPLNVRALELLFELANGEGTDEYVAHAIERLAEQIGSRPDLHQWALAFFIPANSKKGLDALRGSPDPNVRLAVELNQAPSGSQVQPDGHAGAPTADVATAQALRLLAAGDATAASRILGGMEPHAIPAETVRVAVGRELRREGDGRAAHDLLRDYLRARPDDAWAQRKYGLSRNSGRVSLELTSSGFSFPEVRNSPQYSVRSERVLYLLHNSLPFHSAGYAARSQGILKALRRIGWDATGATRLGYPFDTVGYEDLREIPQVDIVDGVPYERFSRIAKREPKHPTEDYVERYSDLIVQKALEERPAILHGASNHLTGLATVAAARRLGIPSIYEVRGLWEITRASKDADWANSDMYRYTVRLERDAAIAATAVITITSALKRELVARGVPAEKISVVPNGVDTTRFTPRPPKEPLATALGLSGQKVIGYIGSVLEYEGIDLLLEACQLIARQRDDFVLLIVGDGAGLARAKEIARSNGLESRVIFTGRVPHSEVENYYSLVDIAPIPRLPLPVCELVSPLKPMEAMAMGKAVVASDVAALSEMVDDGVTGLLHRKGDATSLAATLTRLLDDDGLRRDLAKAARRWVVQQRDWQALAWRISGMYEHLGGTPSTRARSSVPFTTRQPGSQYSLGVKQ